MEMEEEIKNVQQLQRQESRDIPVLYVRFARKLATHGHGGRGEEPAVLLLSILKK